MDPRDVIGRLLPSRGKLIDELAGCLTISEAHWDGDPQTVVHIDRLIPMLAVPKDIVENEDDDADSDARWRVLTAKPPHLYGFPAPKSALEEFHRADARKGRRLLVRDLNAGHIAAVLSWHFEQGPAEEEGAHRSRRAIVLTPDELRMLGLRNGPSRKHGGHADRAYYELST